MSVIHRLLSDLGEDAMARDVAIPHDEARVRYRVNRNTVADQREFARITGDYFNYHYTTCNTGGGQFSPGAAQARAEALLDRQYRRKNGDAMSAMDDCMRGLNGGLKTVLDVIADALKTEAMEARMTEVFNRYVTPNSWSEKVAIIKAFIDHCGVDLSTSIDVSHPERYARDYRELIRAYVDGMRETGRLFRRL